MKGLLNPTFPGQPNTSGKTTTPHQTFGATVMPGQVQTARQGMVQGPKPKVATAAKVGVKKAKVKRHGRVKGPDFMGM
jgi:hypothetical protein